MRYRVLLCLVMLSVITAMLAGCGGTPKPPVDTTRQLQELVQVGQTFEQVQDLMTEALKERVTMYPAQNIKKQVTGNWEFQAKEGGSPGDTDAPYLVLLIEPDPASTTYLAVFFEGRTVTAAEWFDHTGAVVIQKLLGNLLETEEVGQSE